MTRLRSHVGSPSTATPAASAGRGVVSRTFGRVPAGWRTPLLVFVVAVAVQVPFVGRLGLWSDDVVQFLQPHHAAAGSAWRFVVADSTGFLSGGERPVAYVPFALGRIFYLAGVHWLRLFAIALGAAAAATTAWAARRLLADDGFALAAGLLAALWPVAAFVPSWPSAVHYSFAAILSLAAGGVALSDRRRALPLATGLHLASALTLEVFLFAAPVFVVAGLLTDRAERGDESGRGSPAGRWRTIAWMLAASVAVLVWRLLVVHRYGHGRLHYEDRILAPGGALEQVAAAPRLLLWPWPDAGRAADLAARQTGVGAGGDRVELVAAALAAVVVLIVAARRFGGASPLDRRSRGAAAFAALAPGALLTAHWIAVLAAVPGAFVRAGGFSARLAHPAVSAVAVLLAGALALGARVARGRARRVAAPLAAAALAVAVFAGARLQATVLSAHAADWRRTTYAVTRIGTDCPSLAPDSFVVVDSDWPSTLLGYQAAGMSHHVVSSLLIARYDDPSLGGARLREMRTRGRRVRPLHFGDLSPWFAPGDYGWLQQRAVRQMAPVGLERLVLFEKPRTGALRRATRLRIPRPGGAALPLLDRPERCRPAPAAAPSAAFCHAFPSLCAR